ncbi:type I pullulanase [Niallia taxi]|uniref:type I pullulanase n=2 Tax=Bacillaceae TaxID=186817 RepID=UPI00203DFD39|nr:type I pullulanase [Niallia sp. MER 6]MCM3032197.1 type I pullulanase [Niallia sp. MER 6]
MMLSIKRDYYAYLDELSVITILLPYMYHGGEADAFTVQGEYSVPLTIKKKETMQQYVKYTCISSELLDAGKSYTIIDNHNGSTDLQIGAVIRTKEFDMRYFYEGPLGVQYSAEKSHFFLWAPTAQQVKLVLQDPIHSERRMEIPMARQEKGVWTAEVEQDVDGFHYTYLVLINLEWREAVDPYAVAVSVNGEKGVIVDLGKTKTVKPKLPALASPVDSIIYETHIRDFTIHPNSGADKKGTYLGAAQLNTKTSTGEWTGLSYVKELGVTHLELLPVHDFEEVDELNVFKRYNWGYNPSHFNVPEGSYSTNPTDPYARIKELKQLIQAIHEQGIRVIMDVVYNHVYKKEDSPFEKILPGYFFRYDIHGMPSNGTGVGNDIASERLMVRRYILDSVRFWLEEYQIDGFRFDLMGILDVETMQGVREICDSKDPSILTFGEGWNLQTPLPDDLKAIISNQHKMPRIGQFNDQFRDQIKGSTFDLEHTGFALGNGSQPAVHELLSGSIGLAEQNAGIFTEPNQTINYVESHDNHTLWDKIEACFPDLEMSLKRKKHRLATSIVLLSQGIPFLHSGQEFFRTKYGVENSYKSPDEINRLDWDRRDTFLDNVQFIKDLISLRKSTAALRLTSAEAIRKHVTIQSHSPLFVEYKLNNIEDYGDWETLIIYINADDDSQRAAVEEGNWKLLLKGEEVYLHELPDVEKTIDINPIGITIIGKRKETN